MRYEKLTALCVERHEGEGFRPESHLYRLALH